MCSSVCTSATQDCMCVVALQSLDFRLYENCIVFWHKNENHATLLPSCTIRGQLDRELLKSVSTQGLCWTKNFLHKQRPLGVLLSSYMRQDVSCGNKKRLSQQRQPHPIKCHPPLSCLPSGSCYRAITVWKSTLKNNFFPRVIPELNWTILHHIILIYLNITLQ